MRKLIFILLATAAGITAHAQNDFRSILKENIRHFQESEKLSYSLNINMFRDSLSTVAVQQEQMHVYSSGNNQCILTEDRLMIKQDDLLVSVLKEEKTVVLQDATEAIQSNYLEQMQLLLEVWDGLDVEEHGTSGGRVAYRISFPEGSDYSSMELHFNKRTSLLETSTIWLAGTFAMEGSNYDSPRIEMNLSKLARTDISKYKVDQILTKELELTPEYQSYLFYNIVQK